MEMDELMQRKKKKSEQDKKKKVGGAASFIHLWALYVVRGAEFPTNLFRVRPWVRERLGGKCES